MSDFNIDTATPEQLRERIKQLQAESAQAQKGSELAQKRLQDESAARRVQRNDALKQAHAYKTIIDAHKIKHGDLDLSQLSVKDGKVEGDINYTPSGGSQISPPPTPNNAASGLTREQVATMTTDEINARWSEVERALSAPIQ